MKITVAGYGFVGRSCVKAFENTHQIEIVDPQYEEWNYPISQDTEAVIICVSTPMDEDGSCHMGNVFDVISNCPDVPILIKSTISVEGWEQIACAYPDRKISFSPEFLRAATAEEDFLNQKYIIVGNDTDKFWTNLFTDRFENLEVHHCTNEEAILVKYSTNSFLAMKVSFFNQIYDFCEQTSTDFETVRKYICLDERIGPDHSYVTKERGWWGHCFPKDTSAFLHSAKQYNADLSLVQQTVDYNRILRMQQYKIIRS
jgi:UDPglucose 6-dehydrogenase